MPTAVVSPIDETSRTHLVSVCQSTRVSGDPTEEKLRLFTQYSPRTEPHTATTHYDRHPQNVRLCMQMLGPECLLLDNFISRLDRVKVAVTLCA